MRGRRAPRRSSTARWIASGSPPLRELIPARQAPGSGMSTSAGSLNTLKGTSRFTGPGRPPSMVANACRSAVGSMSVRVGCQLRFTYGRMTDGKSAWKCRYVSWNAARLNWEVGILAVIARSADESMKAQASAMGRFADPGPHEVSVATGRCATRKYASAMCPAVCSCRVEMVLMASVRS